MGSALGLRRKSRDDHGPLWRDVRDFGAVADSTGGHAAVTGAAIQAAVDSLKISGRTKTGVVYFPPNDQSYCKDRTIWADVGGVQFRSDYPGAAVIKDYNNHGSSFLLGIPRTAQGQTIGLDHIVDLFGKLDTTAASAAGQRWGIRTFTDSFLSQGSGAFSWASDTDDYWNKVTGLTIDLALDWTTAPAGRIPIMGIAKGGVPYPFIVWMYPGQLYFQFRISDGTWLGGKTLTAMVTPPAAGAVRRFTFQLDLNAATCAVWLDGVQATLTTAPSPADFVPGCRLIKNPVMAWKLAALSMTGNNPGSDYWTFDQTPADLTLLGMQLRRTPQYVVSTPGSAQVRVDGRTSTDLIRYFEQTNATIALFPFQTPPATVAADRFVPIVGFGSYGGMKSHVLFLSTEHGNVFTAISGVSFENLNVEAHRGYHGDVLNVGYALYIRARDCSFTGGGHGIGTWRWGASYTHHIDNCNIVGSNAAIFAYYQSWKFSNTYIDSHGRSTIWGDIAGIFMDKTFIGPYGAVESVVRSIGCEMELRQFGVDIEFGDTPKICGYYAQADGAAGNPTSGTLRLIDCTFGTMPDGRPLVILDEAANMATGLPAQTQINPAIFEMNQHMLIGGDYAAVVENRGQTWTGTTETQIQNYYPPIVNTLGRGGVVSKHDRFVAPPRDTSWSAGSHLLTVPCPADGQYTTWRCVRSGTYGTATTPLWQGFDPVDSGANALACYPRGHCYFGVGTGNRWGWLADILLQESMLRLFTGTAAAPSTALTVGLSARYANRAGSPREVAASNGYARVNIPIASWSAAVNGAGNNLIVATFPTATGTGWGTLQSVFLADAGTNRLVAMAQIDPQTVLAGGIVSFPIGALAVGWTDPTTGFAPAWRSALVDRITRGVALPVPTLYLALSTAPADATGAPTEPAGGGYARVATPAARWQVARENAPLFLRGVVTNVAPLTFPAPTGSWGTVLSAYLMDGASGNNVVAAANLTIPRTLAAGGPAPSFAVGTFWFTCG